MHLLYLASWLMAFSVFLCGCQPNTEPSSTQKPAKNQVATDTARAMQWTKERLAVIDSMIKQKEYEKALLLTEQSIKDIWWTDTLVANGQWARQQGWWLKRQEQFGAALAAYEYARWVHENKGPITQNAAAFLYKPMANIYTRRGDVDKAIQLLEIGLKSKGDQLSEVECHFELGRAHLSQLNYDASLRHDSAALRLIPALTEQDDPHYWSAIVLIDMAGAYAKMEQNSKAISLLQQAEGHVSQCYYDCSELTSSIFHGLAKIATNQGQYETARQYLKKALGSYNRFGDICRECAKIQLTRSDIEELAGQTDSALYYAQLAITEVLPGFSTNPEVHPNTSAYYAENVFVQAGGQKGGLFLKQYRQATEEAAKAKALDHAIQSLEMSLAVMDSLKNSFDYDGSMMDLAESYHSVYALLLDAYYAKGGDGQAQKAFLLSEQARANVLQHKAALDRALDKAAPNLRIQEKQVRADILKWQSALRANNQDGEAKQQLNKSLEQLAHLKQELRKLPGYEQSYSGSAEVQNWVRQQKHRAVVSYYYQPEQHIVDSWYVDDKGMSWKRLNLDDALLRDFIGQLADDNAARNASGDLAYYQRFVHQAQSLYDALVRPLLPEGQLPAELYIVPHGLLAFLPFDVLLTGAPKGTTINYKELPYLLRQTAISYSPSASMLLSPVAVDEAAFEGDYLGVLPDYRGYDGKLDELGEAGQQAASQIASMWPQSRLLLADSATKKRFPVLAPRYKVVHFFGHAEGNEPSWLAFTHTDEAAQQAQIKGGAASKQGEKLLSSGGALPAKYWPSLLTVEEIYQYHFPVKLMALTACRTGWAKQHVVEGPLSISRAFHYAGCPSTLMSLWRMPEKATAEVSRYFFDALREPGVSKAQALQQAKLAYLTEQTKSLLPYYWSGMVLAGDTSPIVDQRPLNPLFVALGLLLAAGAGWLAFRFRAQRLH